MPNPENSATMLCPACQVDLHMTERQGVEIDYCPKCRGVWLDRGELDKILERTARELNASAPPAPPAQQPSPYAQPPQGPPPAYGGHGQRYDDRDKKYYEKRRKKSFFEEIFD